MKRGYFAVLFLTALLIPGAPFAAACGKESNKKTKGEIVSVGEDRLRLKTNKTTVTVLLTEKPRIVRDGMDMPAAALRQGAKVTVLGATQASGEIVAKEIQLPAEAGSSRAPIPSPHSGHAH